MPAGPESSALELRDYLRVLRRRRWLIAAATLVVVAGAVVASFLQTPLYEGRAELLLQQRRTETLFNPNTGQQNDPARNVQTEIQVLRSEPVKAAVRKELGTAPQVSARPVGQTDVVLVSVESTDPDRAAALANSYAKHYIDFRRTQNVNDSLAASNEIEGKISSLDTQIKALDNQIASAPAGARDTAASNLGPQRDSLIQQKGVFQQQLNQLQVNASLTSGGAQIVTSATAPTSPVSPRPKRTAAIALVIGVVFGTGLAFLFEYLDDSIKSKEDVDRIAKDLPVLGLVPSVGAWRDRDTPVVVSLSEPTSAAAEAYRTLRTSIQFMGLDRPLRTLQVTSPAASEGKTTTLANLAVALARAGQRVIVVCCDLRRPRIHDFFGVDNALGFASVLLGEVPLSGALQRVPGETRVVVLASGPPPPNPSELLSSRRTAEIFTALQNECDLVLIDCPPVLPVTDAAVLSSRVDATLLVATAGSTTRKEFGRAIELLHQVDAPLIGTVLNGVGAEAGYGYGYGYGYAPYASRTDEKPGRSTRRRRQGSRA